MRKLTITVSDDVYLGLHARIGQGHIGKFLESLARPHVVNGDLAAAYKLMAADAEREAEASPGRRHAVMVSNDFANLNLNRVQVVPLSSKIAKLYPCEVYVTAQSQPSKAMADQIATVSKLRLRSRIGVLSGSDMEDVGRAIRIQLGL